MSEHGFYYPPAQGVRDSQGDRVAFDGMTEGGGYCDPATSGGYEYLLREIGLAPYERPVPLSEAFLFLVQRWHDGNFGTAEFGLLARTEHLITVGATYNSRLSCNV